MRPVNPGKRRKIMSRYKWKVCPRCEKIFNEHPALNRKDNTTEICPACGMQEAMDQWFDNTNKALDKATQEAKEAKK